MTTPHVLHLFFCMAHRLPMRPLDQVRAVFDKGFENCAHGRPESWRQVLLMDIETLEALGIAPGAVKENITTRGLDVQGLERGQRIRVGEAVLEVTIPCEPCTRMNEIRDGLEQTLRGRRGMLCRVVTEGLIRRGDQLELLEVVTPVAV